MSVQKERRRAMICGPIVFRNALGTRAWLSNGPCEIQRMSDGSQRIIVKIGEAELDYQFPQSYIDECIRTARLVVDCVERFDPGSTIHVSRDFVKR
jgi:hypothetical protein